MARYVVDVMPKREILDPQGKAVLGALPRLGFQGVTEVRQGKRFEVEVDGEADEDRLAAVHRMAETLLANPVIEDFVVTAEEPPVSGEPSHRRPGETDPEDESPADASPEAAEPEEPADTNPPEPEAEDAAAPVTPDAEAAPWADGPETEAETEPAEPPSRQDTSEIDPVPAEEEPDRPPTDDGFRV